jgi:hypothetical protein
MTEAALQKNGSDRTDGERVLIARYGDAGTGCGVIAIVFHGDVSFNECFSELTFRSSRQGTGAHARASATAEAALIESKYELSRRGSLVL